MDPRTASPRLAELGRRVGASERTLSRPYRDEVGMGYTVWRNQLRVHLATLMVAGGRTVTQTASACGYSSASTFVTTFRADFGQIAVPVGAAASATS
ncbi:helix-turn-helix domain-containing protein [bacterium RCC_150]